MKAQTKTWMAACFRASILLGEGILFMVAAGMFVHLLFLPSGDLFTEKFEYEVMVGVYLGVLVYYIFALFSKLGHQAFPSITSRLIVIAPLFLAGLMLFAESQYAILFFLLIWGSLVLFYYQFLAFVQSGKIQNVAR